VAALAECCPEGGGEVCHDRDEECWQVEIPDPQVVTTRFKVAVGHCAGCSRRLQGRHRDQVCDALGAAGVQIGPNAKAFGAWFGVPPLDRTHVYAACCDLKASSNSLGDT